LPHHSCGGLASTIAASFFIENPPLRAARQAAEAVSGNSTIASPVATFSSF
jgi:hypothetical protein